MKKNLMLKAWLLFLVSGVGLSTGVFAQSVRIVATVNTEAVTSYDLDVSMVILKREAARLPAGVDLKRTALDSLVDQSLMAQQIRKLNIQISNEEVSQAIGTILKRNKITLDILKRVLAAQGRSLNDYREEIRNQLKRMRFISQAIGGKIQVTDADVQELYQKLSQGRSKPPPLTDLLKAELQTRVYEMKVQEAMRLYLAEIKKEAEIDVRI